MKKALLLFSLFCIASCSPPTKARIVLNIVTHDEDGDAYEKSYRDHFDEICNHLLDFARVCQEKHAVWHMGCCEAMISAVETHTGGSITFPSGIDNILEYLQDVYGVAIDVHTHDVSTYGALACRLMALDVSPPQVMSGFIYTDHDWVPWTRRRTPILCGGTDYEWQPRFLWGAGTRDHTADPTEYGMWKPDNETNFNSHNPANTLWYYGDGPSLKIETGGYSTTSIITELDNRISQMSAASVPVDYLYPSSIQIQENRLSESGMIDALSIMIDEINSRKSDIVWSRIDLAIIANQVWHGGDGFQLKSDFTGFTVLH